MAISTKLMMRQGQALVMTPQLLQAIKLLQFSNLELSAFLHDELERNPLLEAQEADYAAEGAGRRQREARAEQEFAAGDTSAASTASRMRATGRATRSPPTRRRYPPIWAPT